MSRSTYLLSLFILSISSSLYSRLDCDSFVSPGTTIDDMVSIGFFQGNVLYFNVVQSYLFIISTNCEKLVLNLPMGMEFKYVVEHTNYVYDEKFWFFAVDENDVCFLVTMDLSLFSVVSHNTSIVVPGRAGVSFFEDFAYIAGYIPEGDVVVKSIYLEDYLELSIGSPIPPDVDNNRYTDMFLWIPEHSYFYLALVGDNVTYLHSEDELLSESAYFHITLARDEDNVAYIENAEGLFKLDKYNSYLADPLIQADSYAIDLDSQTIFYQKGCNHLKYSILDEVSSLVYSLSECSDKDQLIFDSINQMFVFRTGNISHAYNSQSSELLVLPSVIRFHTEVFLFGFTPPFAYYAIVKNGIQFILDDTPIYPPGSDFIISQDRSNLSNPIIYGLKIKSGEIFPSILTINNGIIFTEDESGTTSAGEVVEESTVLSVQFEKIVIGDLVLKKNSKIRLSGNGTLKIEGCLILEDNTTITYDGSDIVLNGEIVSKKIISFECVSGDFPTVQISNPECETENDITSEYEWSDNNLVILFSGTCTDPNAILFMVIAIIAGSVVFIIILLLVLFVSPLRLKILPNRDRGRKNKNK